MEYASNGSLQNYLDKNYSNLSWYKKVDILWRIAHGLKEIHKGSIHQNLHTRNILLKYGDPCMTDMGLYRRAGYSLSENTKESVYSILPYEAPEVLRGKKYIQ